MAEFEVELTAEQKAVLEATGDNYFTGQMRFATATAVAQPPTTTLKMSVDGAAVFNTLVDPTYMKITSEMLLVDPVHVKHALVRQIVALESDPAERVSLLVKFGLFKELASYIVEIKNFDYGILPESVYENSGLVDATGNTPLFWAISRVSSGYTSYFNLIKKLIMLLTTDFTHVNTEGDTILTYALDSRLPNIGCAIIEEMKKRGNRFDHVSKNGTALIIACKKALNTVVKKLIGVDTSYPDYISPSGHTALMYCAKNGMCDEANALLQTKKSLPETVGADGKTAFELFLCSDSVRDCHESTSIDEDFSMVEKPRMPSKSCY